MDILTAAGNFTAGLLCRDLWRFFSPMMDEYVNERSMMAYPLFRGERCALSRKFNFVFPLLGHCIAHKLHSTARETFRGSLHPNLPLLRQYSTTMNVCV